MADRLCALAQRFSASRTSAYHRFYLASTTSHLFSPRSLLSPRLYAPITALDNMARGRLLVTLFLIYRPHTAHSCASACCAPRTRFSACLCFIASHILSCLLVLADSHRLCALAHQLRISIYLRASVLERASRHLAPLPAGLVVYACVQKKAPSSSPPRAGFEQTSRWFFSATRTRSPITSTSRRGPRASLSYRLRRQLFLSPPFASGRCGFKRIMRASLVLQHD